MRKYNIENRDSLLRQIAEGVERLGENRIHSLEVVLETPNEQFHFGLAGALSIIAEDLFWDERGNWSDAVTAYVEEL